jgi:hypothetical protein
MDPRRPLAEQQPHLNRPPMSRGQIILANALKRNVNVPMSSTPKHGAEVKFSNFSIFGNQFVVLKALS